MLKAHFGHITYDVEFVDKLDHHVEDREGPYGYSDHPTRQIKVAYQGEQREEYAANTLLHELMHAAADVVGFHPENEEEAVHALTAGLMFFLRDSRNAPLVKQLTTQGACGAEPPTEEPAIGEQVTDCRRSHPMTTDHRAKDCHIEKRATYILEIDWVEGVALPQLVGPFQSKDEAVDWGGRNIPNGEWCVSVLAYPYAVREAQP